MRPCFAGAEELLTPQPELVKAAFLPLTAEHFDLVIPAGHESTREVQRLLKVLSSAWLLDQLASVPGSDGTGAGEPIAMLPPRP